MFMWPRTSDCGFAGVGYVPGKYTYINGYLDVQVMSHEVGHNLGLGHANARNCVVSGTRVTIAADASCSTQAYADPFSTMGNKAPRHNHGSQLGELGWLDASQKVVGTPGNTYTITPYFGTGTTKLVRIPRGDGSFFDLDLRTPFGTFDTFTAGSPPVSGVTIRLGWGTASPTGSPKATELLDATPATTDLKDAPLLVGQSVTDPVSTITFTTQSIGAGGVVVRVTEGCRARSARVAGGHGGRRAEREPRLERRHRQRGGRLLPRQPRRIDGGDAALDGPRVVRSLGQWRLELRLRRGRHRHLGQRRDRRHEDRRRERTGADADRGSDLDPDGHAGSDIDADLDADADRRLRPRLRRPRRRRPRLPRQRRPPPRRRIPRRPHHPMPARRPSPSR